jgi:hypothetical protein
MPLFGGPAKTHLHVTHGTHYVAVTEVAAPVDLATLLQTK